MKNIQLAMGIEQEYIQYRLQGYEPYSLFEKITECGFDSLDDYYNDKREYLINCLDFEVVDTVPEQGAYMTAMSVQANHPIIIFGNTDNTYVFHGTESYNELYCQDNGINVIDYHSNGGNIIISEGDLSVGICLPVKDISLQYILERLKSILSKFVDGVSVDNNDIMIDGKKVIGSAIYQTDTAIGFVSHFSFSDKSDLINSICLESRKPVGYIQGISRDQIRQEILLWLQKR